MILLSRPWVGTCWHAEVLLNAVSRWSELAFARVPVPTAVVEHVCNRGPAVVHASASLGALFRRPVDALIGMPLDALLGLRNDLVLEIYSADLDEGAVIQFHDVTERVQAERGSREAVRRLEDIIDNCAALVYVKGTDGRYVLVNQQFGGRATPIDVELGPDGGRPVTGAPRMAEKHGPVAQGLCDKRFGRSSAASQNMPIAIRRIAGTAGTA